MAMKALRVYKKDIKKVEKASRLGLAIFAGCSSRPPYKVFCKEVVMWKRIPHTNIVPFLGVSDEPVPLT